MASLGAWGKELGTATFTGDWGRETVDWEMGLRKGLGTHTSVAALENETSIKDYQEGLEGDEHLTIEKTEANLESGLFHYINID